MISSVKFIYFLFDQRLSLSPSLFFLFFLVSQRSKKAIFVAARVIKWIVAYVAIAVSVDTFVGDDGFAIIIIIIITVIYIAIALKYFIFESFRAFAHPRSSIRDDG